MAGRRAPPVTTPGNDPKPRVRRSPRLVTLVAVAILSMAVAAFAKAYVTGDSSLFVLIMGPFTLLCGYLFGASLIRKDDP